MATAKDPELKNILKARELLSLKSPSSNANYNEMIQVLTSLPSFNLGYALPYTFPLDGKPMNIVDNRPMFKPLFSVKKVAKREIYLCGRQIGKTSGGSGAMLMNLNWRSGFRVMYVAPLSVYVHRLHHLYFQPMIRGCYYGFKLIDSSCVNNVGEKSFYNGSHFHGVSCFNNAENARGIPADWVFYDEVQALDYDHIPAIRETLGSSKFKWETFMGTALGAENTIATLFNQSSANRWVMRCWSCGHHNIPTTDHDAISMIQPQGISCSKCMKLLDVSRGEWVAERPSQSEDFVGYHIPQTIVPDRVNVRENYLEIYNKLHGIEKYSMTKFCQEVLGLPTESGGRPITEKDIRDASTLVEGPELVNECMQVAGGVDWGGNEVTSFTVGTAVGWHPSGAFYCLGAVRPLGVPENERHLPIGAFMQRLRAVTSIGGDVGFVGCVQNRNLAAACGIPTASIGYVSSKGFYSPKPGDNFVVDRSTLLYIIFNLIKEKKLLFPSGPEFFNNFSKDILAVFVEEIDTPTNASIRRYSRYPERADDFLHALAYAVLICSIRARINLPSMIGLPENASMSAMNVMD